MYDGSQWTVKIGNTKQTTFGSKGTYSAGTAITITIPYSSSDENNNYDYYLYVNGSLYASYGTVTIYVNGAVTITIESQNYTYS